MFLVPCKNCKLDKTYKVDNCYACEIENYSKLGGISFHLHLNKSTRQGLTWI